MSDGQLIFNLQRGPTLKRSTVSFYHSRDTTGCNAENPSGSSGRNSSYTGQQGSVYEKRRRSRHYLVPDTIAGRDGQVLDGYCLVFENERSYCRMSRVAVMFCPVVPSFNCGIIRVSCGVLILQLYQGLPESRFVNVRLLFGFLFPPGFVVVTIVYVRLLEVGETAWSFPPLVPGVNLGFWAER